MLIMMDAEQRPIGADDIQISNHMQRSPQSHRCKLIPDSRDRRHTNPAKTTVLGQRVCFNDTFMSANADK